MKNPCFVIISNESWGNVWFIKHRYALNLAKMGYNVVFLNAPTAWRLKNIWNWRINVQLIDKNLKVVSYQNILPLTVFGRFSLFLNDFINSLRLKFIFGIHQTVIWQFDYIRFINVFGFGRLFRIYHVADPYFQSENDPKLAQKAGLIICTNRGYLEYYSKYKDKTMLVPHCVDLEIDSQPRLEEEIRKQYGRFLIYTGTIDSDLDLDVVSDLAQSGLKILFIGPLKLETQLIGRWEELQRIHEYVGVLSPTEMQSYIGASIGCVVLYQIGKLNQRTPLKVLDYMKSFKPVITTMDPGIADFVDKGIYLATTRDQFLLHSRQAFEEKLEVDKKKVKEYLEGHTYKNAIGKILSRIQDMNVVNFEEIPAQTPSIKFDKK